MKEIIIALIPILGTGLFAFRDVKKHLKETTDEINKNINVMRAEIVDIKKTQATNDWITQTEHQMKTLVETCRPFFLHDPSLNKFVIEFTEAFINHVIETLLDLEMYDYSYISDKGRIDKERVDERAIYYLGEKTGVLWNSEHTKKAMILNDKVSFILTDTVNHKKERVFFESFEFLKHMLTYLNKINKTEEGVV